MAYSMFQFRDFNEIIKELHMDQALTETLDYLDLALQGAIWKGTLVNQVLEETGWRDDENIQVIPKRRYKYKGYIGGLAIEGNVSIYEYMLEGLFRLQIGYDQERVRAGVLLLGKRKWSFPFEDSHELLTWEIESLYPTISLPVGVALFEFE